MRGILPLVTLAWVLPAFPQSPETGASIRRAFNRLYNFDFAGAHEELDHRRALDPQDPLLPSVKAATYLFGELSRLRILEADFFADDDRVVDRKKLVPDPKVREAFFSLSAEVERLAGVRLAAQTDDTEGLFAMCMITGLATDYAALVERRRFGSFSLSKRNQVYARKLLTLNPPVEDAYMTFGTVEYVVGSLPFFLRWFVRMENVKGSKQRSLEQLQRVVDHGRYYGPLARMVMSVIHIREKRPRQAETLLAGLVSEFPDNPLFRKELQYAGKLARTARK